MLRFGGGIVTVLYTVSWIAQSILEGSASLKGRISHTNLHLVPGTTTFAVCLIGAVVFNILSYNYLSFSFVVGCFASGYSIYQGYRVRSLNSFQENNQILGLRINTLQELISGVMRENETLQVNVSEFRRKNERLNTSILELEGLNDELRKLVGMQEGENEKLKSLLEEKAELIEKLKLEVQKLARVEEEFKKDITFHTESLSSIVSSLSEVRESSSRDHRTFEKNLEKFTQVVETIKNASTCQKRQSEQTVKLLSVVKTVQEIFSQSKKWETERSAFETLETLKKMQTIETEHTEFLRNRNNQMAESNRLLTQSRQSLSQSVQELGKGVTELGTCATGLQKTVKSLDMVGLLKQANKEMAVSIKTFRAMSERAQDYQNLMKAAKEVCSADTKDRSEKIEKLRLAVNRFAVKAIQKKETT